MRNGVLMPGMTMPALGPPPPDPHPDQRVQEMREEWDMQIIAWDGVFDQRRPRLSAWRMGLQILRNQVPASVNPA